MERAPEDRKSGSFSFSQFLGEEPLFLGNRARRRSPPAPARGALTAFGSRYGGSASRYRARRDLFPSYRLHGLWPEHGGRRPRRSGLSSRPNKNGTRFSLVRFALG